MATFVQISDTARTMSNCHSRRAYVSDSASLFYKINTITKQTNRPCNCENGHPSLSVLLLETSTVPFHPLHPPTTVEQYDACLMTQHTSCSPRVQHRLDLCDRCSYRNTGTISRNLTIQQHTRDFNLTGYRFKTHAVFL